MMKLSFDQAQKEAAEVISRIQVDPRTGAITGLTEFWREVYAPGGVLDRLDVTLPSGVSPVV